MDFVEDYNKLILAEIVYLKGQGFVFPTHEEYRSKLVDAAKKSVETAQERLNEVQADYDSISQNKSSSPEDITFAYDNVQRANENLIDAQSNLSCAQSNLSSVQNGTVSADVQNDYDDYLINLYFNLKVKMITPAKRTVHLCTSLVIPPQYQVSIDTIKNAIENGDDLFPRLSRQIFKADFKDAMMFDFGITHFHLGMTPDAHHHGLIQGGRDILYAMLTHTDAYFIKIGPHGLWNDRQLLVDIDNSFPNALNPYKTFGRPEPEYSDDDRALLKEENINTSFMVNDKHIMPPGMGFSAAGTSMQATMGLCQMRKNIQRLQKWIIPYANLLKEKLKLGNVDFSLEKVCFDGVEGFDCINSIKFIYDGRTGDINFLKKVDDTFTLLEL